MYVREQKIAWRNEASNNNDDSKNATRYDECVSLFALSSHIFANDIDILFKYYIFLPVLSVLICLLIFSHTVYLFMDS